ncbi:MAG: hypothetical protein DELT_00509 [Desulfovibrio sp.]
MSRLLDAYRSRFAHDDVRQQGSAYNGPCPFCGGTSGGGMRSDRFMVWPEKTENLGETCRDHNVPGVWFCRRCSKSGDSIAFFMEAEGMTFKSACAELGITTSLSRRPPSRRTPKPPQASNRSFNPREWAITAEDPEKWRVYAEKLHAESIESLCKNPSAIAWLAARGLDSAAIERYKIGYLPGEADKPGRYRARAALGLPPKKRDDGSEAKYIFIPRGIVIPHFDQFGRLDRLRIRKPKPDIKEGKPKYLVLEGSNMQPMLLSASGSLLLAAYVVVEAELDAMLIHHASGGIVGSFAALTNSGKPDASQHPIMQQAAAILVATDYDPRPVIRPDGSKVIESPGGLGAVWWTDTYKNAKRWPTPSGKDPGDAFAEGLDICAWLSAGLPGSIRLHQATPSAGRMEPFSTGMNTGGEGRGDNGVSTADSASRMQSSGNNANVPTSPGPESAPNAVRELYYAWTSVPGFSVLKRDDGGISFLCNESWARESAANWDAVRSLQAALMDNAELWRWVVEHNPNTEIPVCSATRGATEPK